MSEDPIGLAGGINPYVFADADPVGGSDPEGLSRDCRLIDFINGLCVPELDPITVTAGRDPWGTFPWEEWSGCAQSRQDEFRYGVRCSAERHAPRDDPPSLAPRGPSCGRRLLSGSVAVVSTLALPSLVGSARALPGAMTLSARSYSYAARAGAAAAAGNNLHARFFSWLAGATATAYRQDVGNFVVAGTGTIVSLASDPGPPSGLPDWYSRLRSKPVLGAGMRLGEGLACYAGYYD